MRQKYRTKILLLRDAAVLVHLRGELWVERAGLQGARTALPVAFARDLDPERCVEVRVAVVTVARRQTTEAAARRIEPGIVGRRPLAVAARVHYVELPAVAALLEQFDDLFAVLAAALVGLEVRHVDADAPGVLDAEQPQDVDELLHVVLVVRVEPRRVRRVEVGVYQRLAGPGLDAVVDRLDPGQLGRFVGHVLEVTGGIWLDDAGDLVPVLDPLLAQCTNSVDRAIHPVEVGLGRVDAAG